MVTTTITRKFLCFSWTRTVLIPVPASRRTAEEQARYEDYHNSRSWGR